MAATDELPAFKAGPRSWRFPGEGAAPLDLDTELRVPQQGLSLAAAR
jgi:hypothetical protein